MKKIISLLIICLLFKQANATHNFLLRLITDKGDMINIQLADIVTIDTARAVLILKDTIAAKLKDQRFTHGKAVLNYKGKLIKVYFQGALQNEYMGDPCIVALEGRIVLSDNSIVVWGKEWKVLAGMVNGAGSDECGFFGAKKFEAVT